MSPNILKTFNKRKRSKNKLELREYGVGAQILSLLQINKIILLTNSKKRIIALDGFNIEIVDQKNMNNKILIVSANYYKEISKNLELGAINTLKENSYEYEVINAPGCFEIPYLIKKNIDNFRGFIS